ncbi:hypothetical protein [Flavobacterium urumqiense]|uniref:Uncharacterized protein n=1 Tax=Flavobacterium urumqiense TaxID=935224 RepID=A0A1H5Y1Q1_9FLAO|nr:hypothetical protein [Flavobacterium urumqiense]SEG17607.1 hypothetical protein SAMN04488130_10716 [Flavobacterium urumqiense]
MKNSGVFSDKKIIFICPKFIGYNEAIKTEIENLGGYVLMFNDRPYNGVFDFFKKINISIIKLYQNVNWYCRLRKIDLDSYNTLFVIRGEYVPLFVLDKCKKAGLEMIMYQWDSVKNCNYLYQKDFFNKISTFDGGDAKLYGFDYFPLFYRSEYAEIESRNSKTKTALFVGTFQMLRYSSVLELKERLNKVGIETIIKIRIPFYHYLKLLMKGVKLKKEYLFFKNISFSEILMLYSSSDIIIDAANENQRGLTMRTFEALGANRILLTNNLSVKQEPFYDSKRIKFFDQEFFSETFNDDIISNLVKDQKLDNWILKLIN